MQLELELNLAFVKFFSGFLKDYHANLSLHIGNMSIKRNDAFRRELVGCLNSD